MVMLVRFSNYCSLLVLLSFIGWLSLLDAHDLLGLHLEASFKEYVIWYSILEKIEYCLAGWNCLNFSKGVRITLIKSSLLNWPIYFMLLFPLPVGVANRLEKLQWHFFCKLVWARVYSQVLKGGLGNCNLM